MVSLWHMGKLVHGLIGTNRFLFLYCVAGSLANVVHLLLARSRYSPFYRVTCLGGAC
jgi:membrane associated rhomboid family serine protease